MKPETFKQLRMKMYYYELGEKRTITEVANKFGVARSTVSGYAALFHWNDFVKNKEKQAEIDNTSKDSDTAMDKYRKYLDLVDKAIVAFGNKLSNNQIKIDTVDDFVKLVKVNLMLNKALGTEHEHRFGLLETKERVQDSKQSVQTLQTVTRIMAEAGRFGGLKALNEEAARLLAEEDDRVDNVVDTQNGSVVDNDDNDDNELRQYLDEQGGDGAV